MINNFFCGLNIYLQTLLNSWAGCKFDYECNDIIKYFLILIPFTVSQSHSTLKGEYPLYNYSAHYYCAFLKSSHFYNIPPICWYPSATGTSLVCLNENSCIISCHLNKQLMLKGCILSFKKCTSYRVKLQCLVKHVMPVSSSLVHLPSYVSNTIQDFIVVFRWHRCICAGIL